MTKYIPRHLNHRVDSAEGAAGTRGRAVVATGTAAALPLGAAAVMTAPAVAVEPIVGDAAAAPAPKAPLAFNARGAEVKALQQRLGMAPDGFYGPMTTAGVKSFQHSNGLVVDGIVGPNTWAVLDPAQNAA